MFERLLLLAALYLFLSLEKLNVMVEAIYKVLKEGDKVGACELICNEENGYTWEIDFGGDTHCIYIISQGGIIKEFKDNSLTMVLLSALSFYYPEEVYSILQQLGVKTD